MRLALSASLTILFGAAGLVEAQAPSAAPPGASVVPAISPSSSPSSAKPLDQLAAPELEQALDFIKKNYVAPGALSETELNRATLAGLLERLGRGVSLSPARAGGAGAAPAPFYREIVEGQVGYLRPGALRKDDLSEMDLAMRNFAAKKVDAIILDLRATAETDDYAMAAEFAERFVPKGSALFTLRGSASERASAFASHQSPAYNGFVLVLIDQETSGAPEALASVLRARAKAILIGQTTAGCAFGYSELRLTPGLILRVAVREALLPEQQPGLRQGVQPDLPVTLPVAAKRQIFQESLTKGMAPFVFESDRPHLNEAALLAGTNPEIEAAQAAQQRRTRGGETLHDLVLQRAVDLITSIGVYEKQAGRAP